MTSAYKGASNQTNAVRTDSGGVGGASRGKTRGGSKECYLCSVGFVRRKDSFVFVMLTNGRGR